MLKNTKRRNEHTRLNKRRSARIAVCVISQQSMNAHNLKFVINSKFISLENVIKISSSSILSLLKFRLISIVEITMSIVIIENSFYEYIQIRNNIRCLISLSSYATFNASKLRSNEHVLEVLDNPIPTKSPFVHVKCFKF